jgi:hypothetical protein
MVEVSEVQAQPAAYTKFLVEEFDCWKNDSVTVYVDTEAGTIDMDGDWPAVENGGIDYGDPNYIETSVAQESADDDNVLFFIPNLNKRWTKNKVRELGPILDARIEADRLRADPNNHVLARAFHVRMYHIVVRGHKSIDLRRLKKFAYEASVEWVAEQKVDADRVYRIANSSFYSSKARDRRMVAISWGCNTLAFEFEIPELRDRVEINKWVVYWLARNMKVPYREYGRVDKIIPRLLPVLEDFEWAESDYTPPVKKKQVRKAKAKPAEALDA